MSQTLINQAKALISAMKSEGYNNKDAALETAEVLLSIITTDKLFTNKEDLNGRRYIGKIIKS